MPWRPLQKFAEEHSECVHFLFFTSFFFGTLRGERCNDGTSTEEGLLKREIEYLPVVCSLSFHRAIGRDETGIRANLRCNVVSSHGGCTDGGCTVKQLGPIRMSTKHPTMLDCLRELCINSCGYCHQRSIDAGESCGSRCHGPS